MELKINFTIEAAHWMDSFEEGHPNRRLHGHSYIGTLVLEGPLGDDGMVMELEKVQAALDPIVKEFDHHCLNDKPEMKHTSMEYLAYVLYQKCKEKIEHTRAIELQRPSLAMSVRYPSR